MAEQSDFKVRDMAIEDPAPWQWRPPAALLEQLVTVCTEVGADPGEVVTGLLREWLATPGRTMRPAAVAVDVAGRRVWVDGEPVHLTELETAILAALVDHPGVTLDAQALAQVLPGPGCSYRSVVVHVSNLRRKLGPHAARIRTVWGEGWRYEIPAAASPRPRRRARTSGDTPAEPRS